QKEAEVVLESVKICESIGIDIPNRSIGSTPTFKIAGKIEGITEIRPGNAVFFDMIQVGLEVASIENCALTIISSVGSIKNNRMVHDARSNTVNSDIGAHRNESVIGQGYIKEYPLLIIDRLSEEHGIITTDPHNNLQIAEKLTIIPNHACTVVILFDNYLIHSKGELIDIWKVDARGKVK